jgi:ABC-type polysaccharide/polyol phosphate transport system ATPase subunit
MNYALEFQDVSKVYRLGGYHRSIRSALTGLVRRHQSQSEREVKAVDRLSFKVRQGEAVGLIGRNGAGKTTVLRLLSRVTQPTSGTLAVDGRLSALIQLGAGFHPDLSGRDNIYLNGAILGLSRAEIRSRFDEIVAFSELEEFLDTPVKRYSSGMYARLGFSVAVHVSPDVLLVDEVLAVGDTAFQYKCMRKMRDFVEEGRSIIFVSHNLQAVQGLCQRALWIDHGKLRFDGPTEDAIDAYLTQLQQDSLAGVKGGSLSSGGELQITGVVLRNGNGRETNEFGSGEDIVVELSYRSEGVVKAPNFTVGIADQGAGLLFLATTLLDRRNHRDLHGTGTVSCRFIDVPLMPKTYQVWGEVRDERGLGYIVAWQPMGAFRVVTPPRELMLSPGELISVAHLKADAPVYVRHTWRIA